MENVINNHKSFERIIHTFLSQSIFHGCYSHCVLWIDTKNTFSHKRNMNPPPRLYETTECKGRYSFLGGTSEIGAYSPIWHCITPYTRARHWSVAPHCDQVPVRSTLWHSLNGWRGTRKPLRDFSFFLFRTNCCDSATVFVSCSMYYIICNLPALVRTVSEVVRDQHPRAFKLLRTGTVRFSLFYDLLLPVQFPLRSVTTDRAFTVLFLLCRLTTCLVYKMPVEVTSNISI